MNLQDVVIITITLARTAAEEEDLKKALTALAALNIPVVAADGGSTESFVHFIKGIPHFTVLHTTGGLLAQVKAGLGAAYQTNRPFIYYTEPDKKDFFEDHLSGLLETVHPKKDTGVVIASRSPKGFDSFPLFQQMTETTINRCCQQAIGHDIDYCYGPFLMSRALVPQLLTIGENIGWGWRPATFNIAARMGLSVEAVSGDYYCPPQQQEEDEAEKWHRMRQLEQNIRGLLLSKTLKLE